MRPLPFRFACRRGLLLRGRAWAAFAVAATLLAIGSFLVRGEIAAAVLHDLVGVGAGVAILAGVIWQRPDARWPWILVGLGTSSFATGDVAYNLGRLQAGSLPVRVGDVAYLVAGVLFAVGLAGFASGRFGSVRAARLLYVDSAAAFVSAMTILWFLGIDHQFDRLHSAWTETFVISSPTFDLLLLALLARLVAIGAHRVPAYRMLAGGVMFGFTGDLCWRLIPGTQVAGGAWVSAAYFASYILLGSAALHPSMRELSGLAPVNGQGVRPRRLALLTASAVSLPAVFFLMGGDVGAGDDVVIFGAALVLVPLLGAYRLLDLVRVAEQLALNASSAAARMEAIISASPLPISVLTADGDVTVWNASAESMSGWDAEEIVGGPAPLVPAQGEQRVEGLRRRALAGERLEGVDVRLRRSDDDERDVQVWTAPVLMEGHVDAVVAVFADVTEDRNRQREIDYLAHHDPLTELPNRRSFEERLSAALAAATDDPRATLALIDIDNFKLINDSYGHLLGDRVLAELAQLFRAELRESEYCARLSGDEYAVLLDSTSGEAAERVMRRLWRAARDYRLVEEGLVIDCTISIGVCALTPGLTPEQALSRADSALYEAKEQGRNRLITWTSHLISDERLSSGDRWSSRIKDALRENRLVLHLQPIVDLATGHVSHHEALTRMIDEHGQLIAPTSFLPHAERLGLIEAIDRKALETVVELLVDNPTMSIFINLDQASFRDDTLLDQIADTVNAEPSLAGRLGIEITERTSIRDFARAQRRLEALHQLGCTLALDDFGTGFSSFDHLKRLPVDFVKVGNGFVSDAADNPKAAQLLHAIVLAAQALGKSVIAEGVESAETAAVLKTAGVAYAQGFHFGRPRPLTEQTTANQAA